MRNMIYAKDTGKRIEFFKGAGVMAVIAVVFFIIYSLVISINSNIKAQEAIRNEKAQSVTVYVAAGDIKQGDTINMSKDKTKYKTVQMSKSNAPKLLLNYSAVDNIARIDIPANTVLTPSFFTGTDNVVTTDLRNQDYSDIVLSKNLKVGDYIDIRERKKDGTDFIVVSKKKVLELKGQTLVTNINESERQFKNNSTVDAALTGGVLYTTIYADPQNQSAAAVNYQLNENIDKMIKANPKVVTDSSQKLINNSTQNQSKPDFANATK